jgi:flagellar biosynthetic protein FliQ
VDVPALLTEALLLALWLSLPTLAACLLVALITQLIVPQVQAGDASVAFVPKWLASFAALWLSQHYLHDRLLGFAARVFSLMTELGR